MKIDAQTGSLTLPGGFVLHSALKMETFRDSGLCKPDNIHNPGTPWFYHYFRDGSFEEHALDFVVCFYENPKSHESALVTCSISALPFSDAAENTAEDNCSLGKDEQTLEINRRLLEKLLGKPHRLQKNSSSWNDYPLLQQCAFYNFHWGQIWCGSEDIKTNIVNVDISLRYSANDRWARQDYTPHREHKRWFWKK